MGQALVLGVSSWREETSSDLQEARSRIELLVTSVAGELSPDQFRSAWNAYLLVEKSIAFIKIELEEENPGRFVNKKMFAVLDERQALGFALKKLISGTEEFSLGDFHRALKELRDARNYLRIMIRQTKKGKLKRDRARDDD